MLSSRVMVLPQGGKRVEPADGAAGVRHRIERKERMRRIVKRREQAAGPVRIVVIGVHAIAPTNAALALSRLSSRSHALPFQNRAAGRNADSRPRVSRSDELPDHRIILPLLKAAQGVAQTRLFGMSSSGDTIGKFSGKIGPRRRIAPFHLDPGAPPEDLGNAAKAGRLLDEPVVPYRRLVQTVKHLIGTRHEKSDIGLIPVATDKGGQGFDRLIVLALAEEESAPEFEVLLLPTTLPKSLRLRASASMCSAMAYRRQSVAMRAMRKRQAVVSAGDRTDCPPR